MAENDIDSRLACQLEAAQVNAVAAERIDAACRHAVAGKLALRDLAVWVRGFGVSEGDFRLLWLLFQRDQTGDFNANLDQAEMAVRLAVSPAQVSCGVERLQSQSLIELIQSRTDRRRQFWKLASAGDALVRAVLANVTSLEFATQPHAVRSTRSDNRRSAA